MSMIRTARYADLESIIEIYNQAVTSKFKTAELTEVKPVDKIEWFLNHKPDIYPIFVYELHGKVVGWISFSPYRKGREALRFTIEISYYVHHRFKRQGIGSELIEYALEAGKTMGYKTLIAIILDKNEASIQLLTKFGFQKWGHLPNVADFDGKECGHLYLGYKLHLPNQ
jgi:phosphinothricin acetyltransferase